MAKLNVSLQTYNELYGLLEKEGHKINDGQILEISKGTALVPPVDFRLVTMRRDCADIVAKTYQGEFFIRACNSLYEFVLNGKVKDLEPPKPTTKKKAEPKTETKDGWG